MIILLDTNIVMDALQERHPFDVEAKDILIHAQKVEFSCYITANTITDIFYLYSKVRNLQSARQVLKLLLTNYKIISVTHEDCINALSIPIEDYEDALMVTCANKVNVDYIISRDSKFTHDDLPVKVIEPKDFLRIISER